MLLEHRLSALLKIMLFHFRISTCTWYSLPTDLSFMISLDNLLELLLHSTKYTIWYVNEAESTNLALWLRNIINWIFIWYKYCQWSLCTVPYNLALDTNQWPYAISAVHDWARGKRTGAFINQQCNMKGQSEIAYLPKFANIMLIVMVIVINGIF